MRASPYLFCRNLSFIGVKTEECTNRGIVNFFSTLNTIGPNDINWSKRDMKKSKQLIQTAVQEIEASKKTSEIPPGQKNKSSDATLVDAINRIFALFRLNYHNQYYAAFQHDDQLKQIKRLWRDSLSEYPIDLLFLGAKRAIECNEYLPTLHQMLVSCQECIGSLGLPQAREAFIEACQANSPKASQNWSHPAVYFAGRDTGWFFLSNHSEKETWPIFKENFSIYVRKVFLGEKLTIPVSEAGQSKKTKSLTKLQKKNELKRLREELGI